MKERNKPSLSWLEKSKNEIENEVKLIEERMERLNDIRIKKLLYEDSEAFKIGYEAGISKACEMLHDFTKMVYKMRYAQEEHQKPLSILLDGGDLDCEDARAYVSWGKVKRNHEAEVDTWIMENYPHLMED